MNKSTRKTIWGIQELMGLKKQSHPVLSIYDGTFSTGDFTAAYDYGAGLLGVTMTSTKEDGGFLPMVCVYTVDDGTWQATAAAAMSLEDSNALIDQVADAWAKRDWKTRLPSEKQMNDFLMPFGMWGEYTG